MDNAVAVKKVHAPEDLEGDVPDLVIGDGSLRAVVNVLGQVLVDVLKDEVEGHLTGRAGAVGDVKESVLLRKRESIKCRRSRKRK